MFPHSQVPIGGIPGHSGSQGTGAGHPDMCNVDRASASVVARAGEKVEGVTGRQA